MPRARGVKMTESDQKLAITGGRTQSRFILLFCYMMLQFMIIPIFEGSFVLGAFDDLIYFTLIFYTLISIRCARLLWASSLLFLLLFISYIAMLLQPANQMIIVTLNFFTSAFLISAIVSMLIFILGMEQITLNGVMGGLCVYLLIGAVFMMLYINVELLVPGSFSFGNHGTDLNTLQMYDLLYFYSFVSLLTIGYGDIVPMSHLAQTLTVLEGLVGQFYMVFCVAVLVGMYVSERQPADHDVSPKAPD